MGRLTIPALLIAVGLVLLADLIVVNETLDELAGWLVDLVVVIAAAAALAGVAALALRHGSDLVQRRSAPGPAIAVLAGMAAVLIAGFHPQSAGASDPAVRWLVGALLVPLGASLFGVLFVSTLSATRRALTLRPREAAVMAGGALVVLVLLLPLGGLIGDGPSEAAGWVLGVPIGAAFRGLLIGAGIAIAVAAARVLLTIGPTDE